MFAKDLSRRIPALFTTASTRSKESSAVFRMRRAPSMLETSSKFAAASPPAP